MDHPYDETIVNMAIWFRSHDQNGYHAHTRSSFKNMFLSTTKGTTSLGFGMKHCGYNLLYNVCLTRDLSLRQGQT